jgi:hypothetical protein
MNLFMSLGFAQLALIHKKRLMLWHLQRQSGVVSKYSVAFCMYVSKLLITLLIVYWFTQCTACWYSSASFLISPNTHPFQCYPGHWNPSQCLVYSCWQVQIWFLQRCMLRTAKCAYSNHDDESLMKVTNDLGLLTVQLTTRTEQVVIADRQLLYDYRWLVVLAPCWW